MKFQDFQFSDVLQAGLDHIQFQTPTEIQQAVIPIAMEGRDLIACAETGSGKTGAYAIPMVERLLKDPKSHGLVLAPTRELVQQISDFIVKLTARCPKFGVTSVVGGADFRRQVASLRRNPRIVVATPGRLIDHLQSKTLTLKTTSILVLDEGDRMLDMGFAPQLNEILKYLPETRQTSLFTATLPKNVQKLAESYLNNPEKINVGRVSLPVASIRQSIVQLKGKEKDDRIIDELNSRPGSIIIFSRTKSRTDALAEHLESYGFAVDWIHGGRSQGQRNRAIQNFRSGRCRILCATDVAARGIDIPQVEHVINFDLPVMDEDYVHRIGRTGRNGASGEALSFVTPEDYRLWKILIKKYQLKGVDLVGDVSVPNKKGRPNNRRSNSQEPRFRRDKASFGTFEKKSSRSQDRFKDKDERGRDNRGREDRGREDRGRDSFGFGRDSFGKDSFAPKSFAKDSRPRKPRSDEGQSFGKKMSSPFASDKPKKKTFKKSNSANSSAPEGGRPKKKTGKKAPWSGGPKFGKKTTSRSGNDRPRRSSRPSF